MNAKCYTFYSYKGGSGRTTTLLNTTKHLAEILNASKEHPILLVDADLESAGLTYFFGCENKFTDRSHLTIHSEAFLNKATAILEGVKGDNMFGAFIDRMFSCDDIATRLLPFSSSINAEDVLSGVIIRETTKQIFKRVVDAAERVKFAAKGDSVSADDVFFSKQYDMQTLLNRLSRTKDLDEKRKIIEDFLPTDTFVDVSKFFGCPEGSIKFIGVDVHFNGVHLNVDNKKALQNKAKISKVCGENGFSTVIFDCGAGVQSTAHVLNQVSDTIVYCMRPTYQFVQGTWTQLSNYQTGLIGINDRKNEKAKDRGERTDKKTVIILPTAVPYKNGDTDQLQNDSFSKIEKIADIYSRFIDDTFCTYEKSLKEVGLFKWREHILGTLPSSDDTAFDDMKPYASYSDMPEDAKAAYDTYRLLAERLCYNS